MSFDRLKRYVPRGLYGRAALILVLPVVLVQLVVSVVFIQRHFEGVTIQMTGNVSRDLNVLLELGDLAPEIGQALAIDMDEIAAEALPQQDWTRWYDVSGRAVIRTLKRQVSGVVAVHLPDDYRAHVYIDRAGQEPLSFAFDRRRLSASNPHQLLVNMVGFGILFTVIAFIYLRNQLRPITRLARAAEAFGRGRIVPYQPSGAVEVRAAGGAFLDMRARIERAIEQRTLMLSGVSHDLRTPLTRMRLAVSMLEDEDRVPLEREIDEMQWMLDEFLSFARGTAEEVTAEVDPVALVREIVADAEGTGQKVRFVGAEGAGHIALRPHAIRRAVENLIANATRYGIHAEVSVTLSEKMLRIRVEDDGPGIPADRREEAVRPFSRLEPARNQNKGSGVGLGLSIATDIARAHGGTLRLAESRRMGGLCADIVIAR